MNLSHYYWWFEAALSTKFCDDVIKLAKTKKEQLALTGGQGVGRNVGTHPLSDEELKFDFGENFQFTKYTQGQYYDWHCDSWDQAYEEEKNDKNYVGKIRKLSATINLSSSDDYEGGCLEFDFRNKDPGQSTKTTADQTKSKGSIIVFPSHLWHRVAPVTKGTRYSLVLWCLGKPFR